jgi:hypothetical protein
MSTRHNPKRKPACNGAIVNPSSKDSGFWRSKSVEELAAEQGVKPIENVDDLSGDFWPADESADEFLAWLRQLRQEG